MFYRTAQNHDVPFHCVVWRPVEGVRTSSPQLSPLMPSPTNKGTKAFRVRSMGDALCEPEAASFVNGAGIVCFVRDVPEEWTHLIVTVVRETSLMAKAYCMPEEDYLGWRRHLADWYDAITDAQGNLPEGGADFLAKHLPIDVSLHVSERLLEEGPLFRLLRDGSHRPGFVVPVKREESQVTCD